MKSKKIIRTVLNMCAIVFLGGFLTIGLMILVYCLPLNHANFIESKSVLLSEGARPDVLERNYGEWSNAESFEPGIVSTTNEIANFDRAAGTDGKSAIYNAIVMNAPDWGPYPRYWHGHCAVIRLLLLAFDVKEMRFLFFLIHLILTMFISAELLSQKGKIPALIFISSYILVMPLAMCSFSDYTSFYSVILLFALISIFHIKKDISDRMKPEYICLVFCTIGAASNVFDKLVLTIIGWGLPILLLIMLYGEERKTYENIITVIASGIGWLFGFAGFMLFKIIFASVYCGENVLLEASDRLEGWTGLATEEKSGISRWSALFVNYKHYTYKIFEILIIVWIIFLVIRLLRKKMVMDSRVVSMFLISIMPILYEIVMGAHVDYHHVYTYRMLSVSIIAVFYTLYCAAGKQKNDKILNCVVAAFLLAVSFVLSIFLKEKYDFNNAGCAYHMYLFDESAPVATLDFNPRYDEIVEFSIGLNASSDVGRFDFSIMDGDRTVYSFMIPASDVVESSWQVLDVDWHFNTIKQYKMVIDASSTEAGSGLMILDDPGNALPDLCGLEVADEAVPGQPVTWIKYIGLYNKRHFLFYSLSWFAFFMAAYVCFQCLFEGLKQRKK